MLRKKTIPIPWAGGDEVFYHYYDDGSCRPNADKQCISRDDYEKACKATKSVSQNFIKILTYNTTEERKALIDGGSRDSINVSWDGKRCVAMIQISGMYQGTSKRLKIEAWISGFVVIGSKIVASNPGTII